MGYVSLLTKSGKVGSSFRLADTAHRRAWQALMCLGWISVYPSA